MKQVWAVLAALVLLLGAGGAQTIVKIPSSPPLSRELEQKVESIGRKLHCPICSGESITQSQTDIARQMLNEVRSQVARGVPEGEILAGFVASYGERILLEPPKRGLTAALWILPVAFLILGAWVLTSYLRRASRPEARELTAEEERRIEKLLAERKTP